MDKGWKVHNLRRKQTNRLAMTRKNYKQMYEDEQFRRIQFEMATKLHLQVIDNLRLELSETRQRTRELAAVVDKWPAQKHSAHCNRVDDYVCHCGAVTLNRKRRDARILAGLEEP